LFVNLMTVFKKNLELQVNYTCCLFWLLLFAVYDSYEIDMDEMENGWYDEEEEEEGEDTGEK